MPDQNEQLNDQLESVYPAPDRFGWLRIWRRESATSLGVSVIAFIVIAVLLLVGRLQWPASDPGIPSVEITAVSLSAAERQELALPETAMAKARTTRTAEVKTNTAPARRVKADKVAESGKTVSDKATGAVAELLSDNDAVTAATREAADAINKSLKRLAQLRGGGFRTAADENGTASKKQWHDYLKELRKRGLDVIITFDSTSSMSAAIVDLKQKLLRISTKLIELVPNARVSLCTYRDHGDLYVVKGIALTNKIPKLLYFMQETVARGGGDAPEAVLEGLQWAREQNRKTFERRARTVIIVFGDAPPHAHTIKDCLALAQDFRRKGGVISTVTIGSRPLVEFSEIAHAGGGTASISGPAQQVVRELLILAFGPRFREHILREFRF